MKILVLSLLRIGDIVLSAQILRGLRERHPQAEIHVMINAQFRQIMPLLPYVDKFVAFDRDRLQRGLGEGVVPVFDSYERLNEQIDELNAESYDQIINLTQNRLSAWLMSVINAKVRTGLCFDAHGRASFGSPWFKYLNTQVDAEGSEVFHFADVFRFALGLGDESMKRATLVETVAGREEADEFVANLLAGPTDLAASRNANPAARSRPKEIVAVQALTSDVKKDWGFARFAAALELFQRVNDCVVVVLGAPFERDRLAPFMQMLRERDVRAELAILSFEGAFSLLRKSKFLLTGDTSVKHLAGAARTPVVEISLGSSDIYRTGAYLHGSVIVQSREACAPCPHSKACHRETHACAARISPEIVAMVACEVYAGRTFQLRAIAEEFSGEVEIMRVDTRATDFWSAYSVLESFSEMTVGRWLDLACKRIWLDNPSGEERDNMGTETLKVTRLLKSIHPEVSEIEWRHLFADFERQLVGVEGRVHGFRVGLDYLRGRYEDPRKMKEFVRGLISFRDRIRHAPLLGSFKTALDQVIEDDISPAFTRFRRIGDLVHEIERRTDIHLRLIRGLARFSEAEIGLEKI